MSDSEKVFCPNCKGSGFTYYKGNLKDVPLTSRVQCWYCKGTGQILKINQVQDLVFEAFASDSVSLRQKCIWKYSTPELEEAVAKQIKGLEDSISDGREEAYIIEEYKGHLERFKEWSEYFLMENNSLKFVHEPL